MDYIKKKKNQTNKQTNNHHIYISQPNYVTQTYHSLILKSIGRKPYKHHFVWFHVIQNILLSYRQASVHSMRYYSFYIIELNNLLSF